MNNYHFFVGFIPKIYLMFQLHFTYTHTHITYIKADFPIINIAQYGLQIGCKRIIIYECQHQWLYDNCEYTIFLPKLSLSLSHWVIIAEKRSGAIAYINIYVGLILAYGNFHTHIKQVVDFLQSIHNMFPITAKCYFFFAISEPSGNSTKVTYLSMLFDWEIWVIELQCHGLKQVVWFNYLN